MELKSFFDDDTFTLTYVVSDPSTQKAAIIDPVFDYDPKSSKLRKTSVEKVVRFLKDSRLDPLYVLETHAHADHLSGAQVFKEYFPNIKVMINERITIVQEIFKKFFNLEESFQPDGSQFDGLLRMGETYSLGHLKFKPLATPGHTPACSSLLFENGSVFTGDALFMPDDGTGRCDFPAGSAEDLYQSITTRLYTLPDETRVFVGHDYMPNGRALAFESTIGDEKKNNIRLKASTKKEEFVTYRNERDATLEAPRLLFQSIQFNIRAVKFPPEESNGSRYLKIPLRMG